MLLAASAFHCVYWRRNANFRAKGLTCYQLFSVVLPGNQAFHLPFDLFFYCGNHRFFNCTPLLPGARRFRFDRGAGPVDFFRGLVA